MDSNKKMDCNKKISSLQINPLFIGIKSINQVNQINTPNSKQ